MRPLRATGRPERARFALVGSPRCGNMWLRRLLVALYGLEELSAHTPAEIRWDALPERCVVQLHWPCTRDLRRLLARLDCEACVLVRHPFDVLVSILHFAGHEPQTARWLDGAAGDERGIVGAHPASPAFRDYAVGPRARALLDVSPQWWKQSYGRVRYEDLVARPAEQLAGIVGRSRAVPVRSIADAVEQVTFPGLQAEATNRHFWQGRPGLWRRVLPAEVARALAPAYAAYARRFGYDLAPDPDLTLDAARGSWDELAEPAGAAA